MVLLLLLLLLLLLQPWNLVFVLQLWLQPLLLLSWLLLLYLWLVLLLLTMLGLMQMGSILTPLMSLAPLFVHRVRLLPVFALSVCYVVQDKRCLMLGQILQGSLGRRVQLLLLLLLLLMMMMMLG